MKFVFFLLIIFSWAQSFGQQLRQVIELDMGNCWLTTSDNTWKLSSEPDDFTRNFQREAILSEVSKIISTQLASTPQEISFSGTNLHCSSVGAKFLFQFKFRNFDGLALIKPNSVQSFSVVIFGQTQTKNQTDGFILGDILTSPNGICTQQETLRRIHEALPGIVESVTSDFTIHLASKFRLETYNYFKALSQNSNAQQCLKFTELNWLLLPAGEYYKLP